MLLSSRRLVAVLCLALLALSAGCGDVLDLSPQQSISQEEALGTPENVESALIGGYTSLSGFSLYGGQAQLFADLYGTSQQEVQWSGTFQDPREVWAKQIQVTNDFAEDQWTDSYDAINRANNVLGALDVLSEEKRSQIEGESRFLRASAYFELLRFYAKAYNDGNPSENPGVPLVTSPTRDIAEDDEIPRSSVEEVYSQIESDLQDAKDLLPETNPRAAVTFADTYVASAMLSRVYLMQGRYEDAAAEANRVIQSGNYALMENFGDAFGNAGNVDETVFAVRVTSQDNDRNALNLFYGSEANQGRGDVDIPDAHVSLYEDGDARKNFFITDEDGIRRTAKWQNLNANIPIIRLAELYLIRAESNFRAGTQVGAPPLADVNRIRDRVGLNALSSSELSLDAILKERELELAFEGHAIHDTKRTERSVGDIPWNANRLVFPIPQREIDANDALTQNPGY